MFDSPGHALSALSRVGYFTYQKTATTVYLAGKINKPIMLERSAGAGKTELALSVARAAGADLLRLQCYQGINEEKAIGRFDKSRKGSGHCQEQDFNRDCGYAPVHRGTRKSFAG